MLIKLKKRTLRKTILVFSESKKTGWYKEELPTILSVLCNKPRKTAHNIENTVFLIDFSANLSNRDPFKDLFNVAGNPIVVIFLVGNDDYFFANFRMIIIGKVPDYFTNGIFTLHKLFVGFVVFKVCDSISKVDGWSQRNLGFS